MKTEDACKNDTPREKTCASCNEDCHDILHNAGAIEIAIRNPSVSDSMNHWEYRALKSEAKLAVAEMALKAIIALDDGDNPAFWEDDAHNAFVLARAALAQ